MIEKLLEIIKRYVEGRDIASKYQKILNMMAFYLNVIDVAGYRRWLDLDKKIPHLR